MIKVKCTFINLFILIACYQIHAQENPFNFSKTKWIEYAGNPKADSTQGQYFRKNFSLRKNIQSATLYITSKGMYEAFINGKRVGDAYLAPGWTSYHHRLQYQQYDVKNLLQKGNNAIGVILGSGWYRTRLAWSDRHYGKTIALLSQIVITYTDGSKDYIGTNEQWKNNTGSIVTSEIYDGETIDQRLDKNGWNQSDYNDKDWPSVKTIDRDSSHIIATENELIKKHEIFHPAKIITTPKGEKVIDFGQNLVGWVIVKAKGPAGITIKIQHGEVLDKEGNFYNENYRSAKATANYILKGGDEKIFEPHFTFYGFRYIKIEGYPGEIKPENFTAVTLYSDMQSTGTFECSNPLINQLQHNIQWGQKGNFLDVPTDCPQRDERLGWTGDAQVFFNTAAYNMNVQHFFRKWLKDLAADQLPNGIVPHVIPNVLEKNDGGSTGWADASTIIPWNMYWVYNDTIVLKNQYASMRSWVEFMHTNSKDNLWNTGSHFGDWLFYRPNDDNDGRSAVTDKNLIAQCFYANSVQIMINAAKVFNRTTDVDNYTRLLNDIKEAFVKEFVTASGRLVSSTQTAYTLALEFDMLPENLRAQAAQRLVDNIHIYGNHLTTGFLGTPYLCHVLSRYGYDDVAYTLLLQDTYPSWLYPVKSGATTIWERWDGQKTDGSFQTTGMNSFNHYAYGAIGDWMYKHIGGIQASTPGYGKIIIKPIVGGKLTWAKASFRSIHGMIKSEWKIENNQVHLHVEIPTGTTAEIYVPTINGKSSMKKEVKAGIYDFKG